MHGKCLESTVFSVPFAAVALRACLDCAVPAAFTAHVWLAGERNYVSIQAGRRVVPTELGITLVRGYQLIDQELCLPQVGTSCMSERQAVHLQQA